LKRARSSAWIERLPSKFLRRAGSRGIEAHRARHFKTVF
jgi:hypothetical protein